MVMRQHQDFSVIDSLIIIKCAYGPSSPLLFSPSPPVTVVAMPIPTHNILGGLKEGMLVYIQKFQDEVLFVYFPVEFL